MNKHLAEFWYKSTKSCYVLQGSQNSNLRIKYKPQNVMSGIMIQEGNITTSGEWGGGWWESVMKKVTTVLGFKECSILTEKGGKQGVFYSREMRVCKGVKVWKHMHV